MSLSRRDWLAGTGLLIAGSRTLATERPSSVPGSGFEPWLELDPSALAHNAETVSRLGGGRPVLAVAKNNAYGLGLTTAGPLLDRLPTIWGFAVVRPGEALELVNAGVKKPVLLMGPASEEEAEALARHGVRLAPFREDQAEMLIRLAERLGRPVAVHLYVDTGMHRMGLPYRRLLAWLESARLRRAVHCEGAFTELVEDAEFDREQAGRLKELAVAAQAKGVRLGLLHAASSDAIMRPTNATFLDLLRPGLALYGGYPTADAHARNELRPAYRLKARVIRVDLLEPGEGVSYHRRFSAATPTWTATLAIGHVDGYPSGAVKGCEVLIGDRLYPVIGTVSASHTIVALGSERSAEVGAEAVVVGPDRPGLHPNAVAEKSGWSEYNMFMHLSPQLARRVRQP